MEVCILHSVAVWLAFLLVIIKPPTLSILWGYPLGRIVFDTPDSISEPQILLLSSGNVIKISLESRQHKTISAWGTLGIHKNEKVGCSKWLRMFSSGRCSFTHWLQIIYEFYKSIIILKIMDPTSVLFSSALGCVVCLNLRICDDFVVK